MTSVKDRATGITLTTAADRPAIDVTAAPLRGFALGVPVPASGAVPKELGLDRKALTLLGFEGKPGQVLLMPTDPPAVAIGIGDPSTVDAGRLRDAAAAFARAVPRHESLSTSLTALTGVLAEAAGQAVIEGITLARYTYKDLKSKPWPVHLLAINLTAPANRVEGVRRGAERGRVFAEAAMFARDLSNAPPAYLTATRMAEVATRLAKDAGLKVEVFDKEALVRMGCGGLLGVNAGSTEPPRMIKLTYSPNGGRSNKSTPHLTLVGKGIMYDSGGISLKPSDAVHATMKQDMSGAGAILAAMTALKPVDCKTTVTGYLMCTDNMPSGSATKLGDVLTIRGGTTVEVLNTDAEGRLVMADALVLAAEEKPDAIVDIATLTGACLRALGPRIAGLFGNNEPLMDQIETSARETDEPVWQLPMERSYRRELDSDIADIKNMGGPNGGAIHAALFLEEFVAGLPWAHLDIAGPVLVDSDDGWKPKGSSGFGTRLLLDLALGFKAAGR